MISLELRPKLRRSLVGLARICCVATALTFLAVWGYAIKSMYLSCNDRIHGFPDSDRLALASCWWFVTVFDVVTFPVLKGRGL
jgi:hypothetical protein